MEWKRVALTLLLLMMLLMGAAARGRNAGMRLTIDEEEDGAKATEVGTKAIEVSAKATEVGAGGGGTAKGCTGTAKTTEASADKDCPDKECPQVAANIAAKAAQVATAANDAQSNAAECAAKEVRAQLAEKALQASRAVQAVLEGKRALLEKIQRELNAAVELVAKLGGSLQHSEANARKIDCVAKAAEAHFARFAEIVQLMGPNVADMEALEELAQTDHSEKRQMLIAAKERCERIQKQITCARDEYQKVKMAAYQAACAAVEAKQKAANTANQGGQLRRRRRRRRRQRQRQRYFQQQQQ